ncbi:MAG: ATP synthase F1 subunit delta [Chitinophagaceae bacterium]
MQNPRLAGRYAKSIIDLAVEKDQLDVVYNDMMYLQGICKSSREFVNLLKSPIIKGDKKRQIVDIVSKGKVGVLTASFNELMIKKGREQYLPEIVDAFIDMYNDIKGIYKVKLTTAQTVSDELKQSIIDKFAATTTLKHIELEAKVDEALVGGFVLEFNNKLVDASILRDLKDIKKQFQDNSYIQKLR